MTAEQKQILEETKTIGYWSVLGGVEVKKFEYGIEDYCLCIAGTMSSTKRGRSYHRLKIYLAPNGDSYVKLYGRCLPFDECIRN